MDSAGHHSHTMETSRHSNTTRRPRGGTWPCSRPGAVRLPFCPQHQTAAVPSPDVPMATLARWHWEWVHPSLGLLSAMCTPSTHPGKSVISGCMEYLSCNAKRTRLGVLGGRGRTQGSATNTLQHPIPVHSELRTIRTPHMGSGSFLPKANAI